MSLKCPRERPRLWTRSGLDRRTDAAAPDRPDDDPDAQIHRADLRKRDTLSVYYWE